MPTPSSPTRSSALRRGLGAAVLCALAWAAAPARADSLPAIERLGRAQPEAAIVQLEALLPTLPESGTRRLAALRLLGALAATVPDPARVERASARIDALAGSFDPAQVRAASAFVRAQASRDGGPLSRADRLLGDALAVLPEAAPLEDRMRYLAAHADVKERSGQLDDAVRLYQQALALADPRAPAWQRAELRSALAYTVFQAGQAERALALNREAVALARDADDDVALAAAMTVQAIVLGARHDAEGELRALEAAIEHARRAGSRRDEVLGLANLADHYLKRGQYAIALRRAEEALPLARALKNRASEAVALINSGLALVSLKRKDDGLASVRAGLAIEERAGSLNGMAMTYGELGQYLERAGYLHEALDAYREHRRLADEVFQREQQQAILELQEAFDNERRERELALLHRQNRIQEEELLRRDLRQRLWAGAAAAAALLLGLAALLVRRVRENNAALTTSNEQLRLQSERDPLTGLANRRHFQRVMQHAGDTLDGTVLLIDVDHFKRINDRCGHAAGDAVLGEIAARLRATLREQDLLVRWGGEEFLVVVRSLAAEPVEALAQRLLDAVAARPVAAGTRSIGVTVSIGFATFPLEPALLAPGWERAIGLVDTAMYLAKAHGRNRACGVQSVQAADAPALDAVAGELEAAWRGGRATLVLLQGPPPPGEAA